LRKPRNGRAREGGQTGGGFMRTWTEEQKARAIKRELTRLRKVFADMPEDRKRIVEGLIQEAAFMRATLEETREVIDREGVLEHFEQGAQRFMREHPATKVYAAMVNRYSSVVKQLLDQLPDGGKQAAEGDDLMAFVKRRTR